MRGSTLSKDSREEATFTQLPQTNRWKFPTSNTYNDYVLRRSFLVVPTQEIVGQFIATFREFPPRQRPSSFSVDRVMQKLEESTVGSGR